MTFTSAKDGAQKTLDVVVNATTDPSKFASKDMPNTLVASDCGGTEMIPNASGPGSFNANTAPHEVAHMIGLGDQHSQATGEPNPGAEGTLMGDPNSSSATLTQGEIDEAGTRFRRRPTS